MLEVCFVVSFKGGKARGFKQIPDLITSTCLPLKTIPVL